MQALIQRQPFKIHPKYIGIFEDTRNTDWIHTWIKHHLFHFGVDRKPEVTVTKREHWGIDNVKQVTYDIIYLEGFIKLELITVKLNQVCEAQ